MPATKERQQALKGMSRADDLQSAFDKFDQDNPHIWKLFVEYSNLVISRGHKRFSASMIIERIRWYDMVETVGDTFTINNNWTAFYARKWQATYPEHAALFETRHQVSKTRTA